LSKGRIFFQLQSGYTLSGPEINSAANRPETTP
jgi:hypothetical protein